MFSRSNLAVHLQERSMKNWVFFLWILQTAFAAKLVELQLKTLDVDDAGMDDSELSIDICSKSNCCAFDILDYPYNQFERGLIEGFTLGQLQECQNFEVSDVGLDVLKLDHSGSDGWRGEYVRLLLDSGLYYHCPINAWLDDTSHLYLECTIGQQV